VSADPVVVLTLSQLEEAVARVVRRELQEARPAEGGADCLVTERVACERLGLSRRTIQRMVARGEIPSIKVGKARRLNVAGLLRRAS
jgi:excisionase family DNA binding protein